MFGAILAGGTREPEIELLNSAPKPQTTIPVATCICPQRRGFCSKDTKERIWTSSCPFSPLLVTVVFRKTGMEIGLLW